MEEDGQMSIIELVENISDTQAHIIMLFLHCLFLYCNCKSEAPSAEA